MRKQHVELRKSYLDDLAIALAKKEKTTKSKMMKQLIQVEEQRATFKKIAYVNKKIKNLSTSYVTVKDEEGNRKQITDPLEIEKAICAENRKKYHQSEATCPFLQEPLATHFGPFGDGPKTQEVLDGTYTAPSELDAPTLDFLQACAQMDNTPNTDTNKQLLTC